MNTIIDKLNLIKNSKESIRQAIISKGITCDEDTPFDEYLDKVESIGGSGGILNGTNFSGLVYYFDGINNLHKEKGNTWYSLVGMGAGTLKNSPTWGADHLNFNGVDNWVSIGALNLATALTVELVISHSDVSASTCPMGNFQSGGWGFFSGSEGISFWVHNGSGYVKPTLTSPLEVGKIYYIAATYDSTKGAMIMDNSLEKVEIATTGSIKAPTNITIVIMGANPSGSTAQSAYFPGNIYSARVWNRALTEEEIMQNMAYEQARFGF